jgi:hypothetical protein
VRKSESWTWEYMKSGVDPAVSKMGEVSYVRGTRSWNVVYDGAESIWLFCVRNGIMEDVS